ncbi:MAG: CBS domain-containing protein [Nitrospirae bacterium]|nr:CBS domain-containing protein [Nitrospirota bacterium]
MDNNQNDISGEDLRAALREVKTYIDITEEDLKKIYEIALRHAKERLVSKVLVRDVMTKDVIVVQKYDDIHKAAKILSENNISGLPVVDKENYVAGVISEADILLTAGMRRGHTFKDVLRHILGEPLPERKSGDLVGDIMSSPAITTKPDVEISEVARVLDEKRIKRLPVVDNENKLIGIISRADIVRAMSKK